MGGITYRPFIEVNVSGDSSINGMAVMTLLDSGTDSTLFSVDIAKALGIDLNKCKKVKVGGIGERDGYISEIRIGVPDFKLSMKARVIFIEEAPFDGLLGQRDFFDKFRITFDKHRNTFELRR